MNALRHLIAALFVCGLLVQPAFVGADAFDEQYGAVILGNIFLRERGRAPANAHATSRPSVEPTAPERALMLTGIVTEDGEARAYFEDRAGGGVLRVVPGDPIARGHVADIALNAVAYQGPDGTIQWIAIGQDLTGAAAAPGSRATAAGPPTTEPSDDVDPSTLSVAEQMRRKRQQLLNRN